MSLVQTGDLKLKKNIKMIYNILNGVRSKDKGIFAWKLFGKNKLSADLQIDKIRRYEGDFIIHFTEKNPVKIMRIISGSEKINFFVPGESVFFQATIKAVLGDHSLQLHIPSSFAQVERRKHLRLTLGELQDAKVRFKKFVSFSSIGGQRVQMFSKDCFDISAGGLSFLVSKNELKCFSVKEDISSVEITLGKNVFFVQGRIVNVIEIEPNEMNHLMYKGWKICLKFATISSHDMEMINRYVFNHATIQYLNEVTN